MKVLGLGSQTGSMTFPMSYDSQGEFFDYTLTRKGWRGLSSLEKSLSVSLGVVSTLAVALMIAVIVVGVQLNDKDCQLVSVPATTCAPPIQVTTPIYDICNTTARPRPTRRSTPRSVSLGGVLLPPDVTTSCIVSDRHKNTTICLTPSCIRVAGQILESIDFTASPCENFYQFACGGSGGGIKSNPSSRIMLADRSQTVPEKLLEEIKGILEMEPSQNTSSFPPFPSRSFRLAKQFYHSCMHPLQDEGVVVAEIRALIDTIMITPVPTTKPETLSPEEIALQKMQNVAVVLADVRRVLNDNYIINVDVRADDKNSSNNAIYLNHPESGLPSVLQDLIIDLARKDNQENTSAVGNDNGGMPAQQKFGKTMRLYGELVKKVWLLVYPEDAANLEDILQQITTFEGKLQRLIGRAVGAKQEIHKVDYHPLSQMDNSTLLNSTMVSLLKEFATNVIKDDSGSDIDQQRTLTETGEGQRKIPNVIVKNVKYFQELEEVLKETSMETIERYLKLRIILSYAPHAGQVFLDSITEFKRKAEGTEMQSFIPRWQFCAAETNKYFGWVISYELVYSSGLKATMMDIKQKLNETTSYLKDSLRESFSVGIPWIVSNDTRQKAQRKLAKLQTFLGFPSEWIIEQGNSGGPTNEEIISVAAAAFVEEFYSDMNFTDPLNNMQNYVEMKMWLAQKELKQIYKPTLASENFFDLFLWPKFLYPSSSKALYAENLNYLLFPAGVIDPSIRQHFSGDSNIPFFQYGSVGVLMAQLMLQGFDEQGSQRTARGNIDPWWDMETREKYRNYSECFRHQYFNGTNANLVNSQLQENIGAPQDLQNSTKNISQRNKQLLRHLILQNEALALAYQAYHSRTFDQTSEEYLLPGLQDYTPEQLFFLTFAQGQCSSSTTSRRLVENVLGNSVEFAKQWKCPLQKEQSTCRVF